jgi:hypothetical protein
MASYHRVAYTYDPEVGNYSYGLQHPMKVSGRFGSCSWLLPLVLARPVGATSALRCHLFLEVIGLDVRSRTGSAWLTT